jgi:hypothetical protein
MSEEALPIHFEPHPPRAEGVTDAERYLKRLCDKTFLSLWSHAGIYRDQGKAGSGDGKEVCDLLVVFKNDIIIFSDKDCRFPNTENLELDWSRWFRRAVEDSAKQIWGAERWIRKYPHRLFLDRACTRHFPIDIPPLDKVKFHRVVVAHDASLRCRAALGGSGSLMLMPDIIGKSHYDKNSGSVIPFAIGQLDPAKGFVHVFDDISLEIVLTNRDTIADFVHYLTKKEAFIESGKLGIAAGEEDLLGFYLGRLNSSDEHDFTFKGDYIKIAIDEGHWERFLQSPEHASQVAADEVSYLWDHLIEKFTYHFLNGTSPVCSHPTYKDQERLFRLFARESRFRRRILSRDLLEAAALGDKSDRFLRVRPPAEPEDPYYVFLILKPSLQLFSSYERYREIRGGLLECACRVVKTKYPAATDIVGIATEPMGGPDDDRSEDAIYFDASEWTEEMQADALQLQQKLGLMINVTERRRNYAEYPSEAHTAAKQALPSFRQGKQSRRNSPCPCGSGRKFKKCCML